MGHRPSLLSKLTASAHRLDAAVLQSEFEKLARRQIPRGRLGDHEGNPAIYNPWYELQATLAS
jgi:hypothetical protein